MTMTYGPATLTDLVTDGTFPGTTRVLTLEEGTFGNASFLALPSTSGTPPARRSSPTWPSRPSSRWPRPTRAPGASSPCSTSSRLDEADRAAFTQLPASPVVPPYEELSENAQPELSADWVSPLDEGWRRSVLAP
jgi:putative spermidine/putrescine transport system substrate-binding protein